MDATLEPRAVRLDTPWRAYIPKALQQRGLSGYEPYALECFLALCDMAPAGAVFDVGANIGLYAMLASSYSNRVVHCFEPTPQVAATARAIASANGLATEVVELAFGARDGSATFYLSAVTDASNSLNPEFRDHLNELVVPVERIDGYIERTGIRPAIIKVDTETTEPDVLAGAARYLREARPWLMVEVLPNVTHERLHEVMDPLGYTYYHLNGAGPRPATTQFVGDASAAAAFMYLLAPQPVEDAFWERMNAWAQVLRDSTVTPDEFTATWTAKVP